VSVKVHSLTLLILPGICDVTPGLLFALIPELPLGPHPCKLHLGPHPCKPFCLGREPKVKAATQLSTLKGVEGHAEAPGWD